MQDEENVSAYESESFSEYESEEETDIQEQNYENETTLITACKKGQLELVKILIEKGADVNLADSSGETPLMAARTANNIEIAKYLIEKGANVNAKNYVGQTALMFTHDIKMLKLLLDAGANINDATDKDENGYTTLSYSARDGKIDFVKFLISAKADVNKGDPTPLMLAAQEGRLDVVKLLLEAGANVNLQDKYGNTALMYTANQMLGFYFYDKPDREELIKELVKNKTDIARLLLDKGADPNLESKNGQTVSILAGNNGYKEISKLLIESGKMKDTLLAASLRGDEKAVKEFIKKGEDVNAKDKEGFTILMSTVRQNYPEITKMLIDAGADVNAASTEDKWGNRNWTTLALAAANGQVENVKLLLAAKADVNAKGYFKNTPLHYAANNAEITKLLLEAGAQVNAQGEDDKTSLMLAAKSGNKEVVKMLLEAGADVNIENYRGDTAFNYVYDNKEIVELLEKYKKDTLMDACYRLDIEAVKKFIENGADVNALYKYTIMVGGVDWDGYEIKEHSALSHMLNESNNLKGDIAKLKKRLAEEKAMAALSPKEWEAKYGDCIVCGDFDPERTAQELTQEIEREKKVAEIIKLLKAAGAKE